MEMSSPELQSFINCNDTLINVIKIYVTPVTSRCLAKGLIPESVEDRTLSTGVTDYEKATLIVRCVRGKIKENPLHYNEFIDVLKEGGLYYKELIETLQQKNVESKKQQNMKNYRKIVKEKLSLKISLIRFVHLGLPRAGKTATQLRLFGEILDLFTAGVKNQPSTGVAETYQVILGLIESQKWSIYKNMQEEMGIMNEILLYATESTTSEDSTSDPLHIAFSAPAESVQSSSPSPGPLTTEDVEELFDNFKEATSPQNWDKTKHLLEKIIMLLNTDTGGQTAFLDMLAPLVLGPSLHLVYHRLTDKLDQEYPVWATNDEGIDTKKEDSTITVEEFLFQALSSIACFSNRNDQACSEAIDKNTSNKSKRISRRSKTILVGTFRDEMKEEDIKKKDELLQKKMSNTKFFQEGSVEYAYEKQLLLDVNNKDGGQADLDKLRGALERVIKRCFAKITIPAAWLILSLYIRMKKVPTMKFVDCEGIAGKLNIDSDELRLALWFFHHMMGIIFYYPEIKELKDIVICDVRVVFDSITKLVKNSFVYDIVGKAAADKFQETARFSQDNLDIATSGQTDSLISLPKLVKLLEYLNIITTLPSNSEPGSITYFMPCLLRSAKDCELRVQQSDSDPASLMLHFEYGYVPLGIFPATITNLTSQKLKDWELCGKVMKNKVRFRVGRGSDMVTLISRPKFIEIALVRSKSASEISTPELCARVRSVIWSTLEKVTTCMHYDINNKHNYFAFECPRHPGKDNHCTLDKDVDSVMKCSHDPIPKYIDLDWKHKVWFNGAQQYPPSNDIQPTCNSMSSLPTMHDLIRKISLADGQHMYVSQEVGTSYPKLSVFLLNDNGSIARSLEKQYNRNTEDINFEIFRRWLAGEGKLPVSWDTLIEVLEDIQLNALAGKIKLYTTQRKMERQ